MAPGYAIIAGINTTLKITIEPLLNISKNAPKMHIVKRCGACVMTFRNNNPLADFHKLS